MRWLTKLLDTLGTRASEHTWREYTQSDTDRRMCTVCGEEHMFLEDIGVGGDYWITVKRGSRKNHDAPLTRVMP